MAFSKPKQTEKPCAYCGTPIVWTKNMAKEWDKTLYCSNTCTRMVNRKRRQNGEEVGVPPPFETNELGVRIWNSKKPKLVKKGK